MPYYFIGMLLCGSALMAQEINWLQMPTQQLNQPHRYQLFQQLVDDFIVDEKIIDIFASQSQQQKLASAGFNFTVKQVDLNQFYAQRAQRGLRSGQRLGGFRSHEQINQHLRQLVQQYPQTVALLSLGLSYEGREILAVRLSDNPQQYEPQEPTVWFDALHHAREPMSAESLLYWLDWLLAHQQQTEIQRLLQTRNILIIPCVNPDGYAYNQQLFPNGGGLWRKNRRQNDDGSYGVDLNRNYGWEWGNNKGSSGLPNNQSYRGESPFSEPETEKMQQLLHEQPPNISISVHSFGNQWMYPWGYQSQPTDDIRRFEYYSTLMTNKNHYDNRSAWALFGATNGASDDYHYGQLNSLAFTVEVGGREDGFWPKPERIEPLSQTVLSGYQMAVKTAGTWLSVKNRRIEIINDQQAQLIISVENQGTMNFIGQIGVDFGQTTIHSEPQNQQLNAMASTEWRFPLQLDQAINQPQLLFELTSDYEGFYQREKMWVNTGIDSQIQLQVNHELYSQQTLIIQQQSPANRWLEIYYAQDFTQKDNKITLINPQLLFAGRSDDNGQKQWQLNLTAPLPFTGETLYLQATMQTDGQTQHSPIQAVEMLY